MVWFSALFFEPLWFWLSFEFYVELFAWKRNSVFFLGPEATEADVRLLNYDISCALSWEPCVEPSNCHRRNAWSYWLYDIGGLAGGGSDSLKVRMFRKNETCLWLLLLIEQILKDGCIYSALGSKWSCSFLAHLSVFREVRSELANCWIWTLRGLTLCCFIHFVHL